MYPIKWVNTQEIKLHNTVRKEEQYLSQSIWVHPDTLRVYTLQPLKTVDYLQKFYSLVIAFPRWLLLKT